MAQATRSYTPPGSRMAAVHAKAFLDGPLHHHLVRARDATLQENPNPNPNPNHKERNLCIQNPPYPGMFCRGLEEDVVDMVIQCERSHAGAQALCSLVKNILVFLPSLARGMRRIHGVEWSTVLMAGVIPLELQYTSAQIRGASHEADEALTAFVLGMI